MTMKIGLDTFFSRQIDVILPDIDIKYELLDYDTLMSYDKYLVAFSGGKDSLALVLALLKLGIPKEKIELWHHLVDGQSEIFMDWECTEDYCKKVAEHLGIAIYFSWKQGGIERELFRENTWTAPINWETPFDGIGQSKTIKIDRYKSTRRKYPQISPNLSVRWCSAYLKIDVMNAAIRGQKRFRDKKVLVLSGERAEESAARKNYAYFEIDRSDSRAGKLNRHVDRARLVHHYTEKQVWDLMKEFRINAHPCYHLGWSRLSCKFCIFGSAKQWKTLELISPDQLTIHIENESIFDVTIKRKKSILEYIELANPFETDGKDELIALALSHKYNAPVFIEDWEYPLGAFRDNYGPS